MKKCLIFPLLSTAMAAITLASCIDKGKQGNSYMEEQDPAMAAGNIPDTAFYGHLGEGTGMSCLQLVTDGGDTLILNKTDEKSGADGLILGEIANYTDRFSITTCDDNQSVSVALNVTQLAKEWRSKDEKDHGFSLMAEGRAKALPEGKYKYNRWGLCNCHLVLLKENEGAHGAETAADTLRILSLAPDSLVLQDLHDRQEQETFIH